MRRLIFMIFLLNLTSCGENDEGIDQSSLNFSAYYPLDDIVRDYEIFHVDIYNSGDSRDTSRFRMRERRIGTDINIQGDEITIIEQSTQTDKSETYLIKGRVTDQIINGEVIRTEGNISQTKLILPPQVGLEWSGNKRFDQNILVSIGTDKIAYYKNWESKYSEIDIEEYQIGSTIYKDLISVIHANFENRLEYRYSIEYYAKNIGLVYKEIRVMDTQCIENCESIPWETKGETGQIFIQSLVNHYYE